MTSNCFFVIVPPISTIQIHTYGCVRISLHTRRSFNSFNAYTIKLRGYLTCSPTFCYVIGLDFFWMSLHVWFVLLTLYYRTGIRSLILVRIAMDYRCSSEPSLTKYKKTQPPSKYITVTIYTLLVFLCNRGYWSELYFFWLLYFIKSILCWNKFYIDLTPISYNISNYYSFHSRNYFFY